MFPWRVFRYAISSKCFYILGAGASRPEIGTGGNLGDMVREAVFNNGIYLAEAAEQSPLKESLLRPYRDGTKTLGASIPQNELDGHTPPELVEMMLARILTLPAWKTLPQYRVFNLFAPSGVCNFNVDNLGDGISKKHSCIYPHGKINAAFAHSKMAHDAAEMLIIPPNFLKILDYHRPLPEPVEITNRPQYRLLEREILNARMVVVIGYSFGAWNNPPDDAESFTMLTELLRYRPKPILVIDPRPEELVFRLESAIRSKCAVGLRCEWNVLAQYVLTGRFLKMVAKSPYENGRDITMDYQLFKERNNRGQTPMALP